MWIPVGVEAAVAMFKVREQVGVQEFDVVYEAVAPEGRPEVEKETDWEDPELRVAVTVLVRDCPWVADLLPPLVSEKSNAGGSGVPFEAVMVTVRSAVVLSE
jgi:hypothetical protein